MAKYAFAIREGDKVAVMRPENADYAMEMLAQFMALQQTEKLTPEQSGEIFNELLLSQPYKFVGLLSTARDGKLVDERGWSCGKLKRGDSFVSYEGSKKIRELERELAPKMAELRKKLDETIAPQWRKRAAKAGSAVTTEWRQIDDGVLRIVFSIDPQMGIVMSAKELRKEGPVPWDGEEIFLYVTESREHWTKIAPGYWQLHRAKPAEQG